jgi:endonuclease YncB( thermonuclease family)
MAMTLMSFWGAVGRVGTGGQVIKRVLLIAVVILLLSWAHGQMSALSGPVRVIDGDTTVLTNSNTHIRLNGVDAPEVVHPGYEHDDAFGPESREEMRRMATRSCAAK